MPFAHSQLHSPLSQLPSPLSQLPSPLLRRSRPINSGPGALPLQPINLGLDTDSALVDASWQTTWLNDDVYFAGPSIASNPDSGAALDSWGFCPQESYPSMDHFIGSTEMLSTTPYVNNFSASHSDFNGSVVDPTLPGYGFTPIVPATQYDPGLASMGAHAVPAMPISGRNTRGASLSAPNEGRIPCRHEGCFSTFKRPGDFRRHMKSHKPGAYVKCIMSGCDMSFPRLDKLNDHLKRGHKVDYVVIQGKQNRGRRGASGIS